MPNAKISLAVLLLALGGCASNGDSSREWDRKSARIVGDLNSCARQPVALTIRSVDGHSTVSGMASFLEEGTSPCAYPAYVDVPPGYRTIGVAYSDGEGVTVGTFSLNAEAGRIYDISVHANVDSYWFDSRPRVE